VVGLLGEPLVCSILVLLESFTEEGLLHHIEVQVLHMPQGKVEEVALSLDQLVPFIFAVFENDRRGLVREASHLKGFQQLGNLGVSPSLVAAHEAVFVNRQNLVASMVDHSSDELPFG